MTSDYPAAARDLNQALTIYRDLGDRLGQANVLSYLGSEQRHVGDNPGATQAFIGALDIYRDLGDGPARPTPCTISEASGGGHAITWPRAR